MGGARESSKKRDKEVSRKCSFESLFRRRVCEGKIRDGRSMYASTRFNSSSEKKVCRKREAKGIKTLPAPLN